MERLIGWFTSQQGAQLRKLVPVPGSRQLVTSEDVEAGDTLISIPQELLLHSAYAFQDAEYKDAFRKLAAELRASEPALDDRHFLCMLLVLEKARQGESAWDPYISILPEEYDDPYWWHDDQLQLLKGTRLSRAVSAHQHGLQSITASLQRLDQLYSATRPQGSPPSVLQTYKGGWALKLHAARWARSTVWSRSFTIRQLASGQRNVVAMVPVLDMIDHSPAVEVVWHTGKDGTEPFQFTPLTSVKKGSVMFNNYGRKSSDELLLAYGFLLDQPNPADHIVVSLAHSRLSADSQPGPSAGDRMEVDGQGDGGEEDQTQQQQAAEDLQRALALSGLGLEVDQKLSAADPLPAPLLLGAQLCLLPESQLYLWTAQRQRSQQARVPSQLQGGAGTADNKVVLHADLGFSSGGGGVAPGDKRSWQQAELDPLASDTLKLQRSTLPAEVTQLLGADSAMHIQPSTQRTCSLVLSPSNRRSAGGSADGACSCAQPPLAQPAVHLLHRLQALVSMREQLQARIAGMASDRHLQAAQIHSKHNPGSGTNEQPPGASCSPAPACEHTTNTAPCASTSQPPSPHHHKGPLSSATTQAAGTCAPQGVPYHSHLAAAYVSVQKSIVRQSLDCIAQRIGSQIEGGSDFVQQALEDGLLACTPLTATASEPLQLPDTFGSPASLPQPAGHAWSALDPDVHVRQYVRWLQTRILVQQAAQQCAATQQIDSAAAPGSMQVEAGGSGTDHASAPGCALQEVVYRRCAPTAFASRKSSREGSFNSSGTVTQPAPPAAPPTSMPAAPKPTNGRTRGPPKASNTFTLKGAKPNTLPALTATAGVNPVPTVPSCSHPAIRHPPPVFKRVSLPAGLAASIGVDTDHDPMALGAQLTSTVSQGDVVARVPLDCCLSASSRDALVSALMMSASRVLQALLTAVRPHIAMSSTGLLGSHASTPTAAATMAAGMATAAVSLAGPADMLTWHLLHTVSAPACARLMSDLDGVQLLAEMLEDSPAGSACQEAYDVLRQQYQALHRSVVVSSARRRGANAKGDTLLWLLGLPSSFCLFTWAAHAVDQHALRTADGTWLLAPVLSSAPADFLHALFVAEVHQPQPATTTPPQAAVSKQVPSASTATAALVVRAACALPGGLHLTPLVLLPGQDTEQVMITHGPEALPWQKLLHQSIARHAAAKAIIPRVASTTHPHPLLLTHRHSISNDSLLEAAISSASDADSLPTPGSGAHTTGASDGIRRTVSSSGLALLGAAGLGPTAAYEMYICPGERDPLGYQKLLLLAALGLGCVHFLTQDLNTESLIMSTLKVCLGNQELMAHPAVQQCLELHAAWKDMGGQDTSHNVRTSSAPSSWLASAGLAGGTQSSDGGAPAAAASGRGADLPVTKVDDRRQSGQGADLPVTKVDDRRQPGPGVSSQGVLTELAEAQAQVFAILGSLAEDHPVCRASRKQLRQMVHDARKNTRRRLKQLEAVHNVVAQHMSNAAGPSGSGSGPATRSMTYGVTGALGGSYHSLGGSMAMHDGVRLYLSGVCDVLDAWADHLGLNRQSDSMSKRHKSRHEES